MNKKRIGGTSEKAIIIQISAVVSQNGDFRMPKTLPGKHKHLLGHHVELEQIAPLVCLKTRGSEPVKIIIVLLLYLRLEAFN